jgi:hypothetical protein
VNDVSVRVGWLAATGAASVATPVVVRAEPAARAAYFGR